MFDLSVLPLSMLLLAFALAALLIAYAGVRLAQSAEVIALESGLGQALVGALFLGASTSISGSILSFYAAASDHPSLAISNAIGGIAAQTAFLAIADFTLKNTNLEHAASSLENLLQSALLMILLAIPVLAYSLPAWTLWGVSPASLALLVMYLAGLVLVRGASDDPQWTPKVTSVTQQEPEAPIPGAGEGKPLRWHIERFVVLALVLAAAGVGLAESAIEVSSRTGLSETAVGALVTSVITSLPELITVLAAVRQGALNLAVGDIIGGNSFDVLFLAGSDVFYRGGSLYQALERDHLLQIATVIIMAGILLLGQMRRQEKGPANVGFESITVLVLYVCFVAYILLGA
ncbi:MAG: hypothetical protein V2J89_09955 [Halieaceae bacterium]|nr:hypothetical protein [Halieaceae bacterium]